MTNLRIYKNLQKMTRMTMKKIISAEEINLTMMVMRRHTLQRNRNLLSNQSQNLKYLYTCHSQRRIIPQESQVPNMRKLNALKMKSLSSKRKMLRLMLLHQVLCMVKGKVSSTIILRRHGYKNRPSFHILVRVKTSYQLSMSQILQEWSRRFMKLNQRNNTYLQLIIQGDLHKRN